MLSITKKQMYNWRKCQVVTFTKVSSWTLKLQASFKAFIEVRFVFHLYNTMKVLPFAKMKLLDRTCYTAFLHIWEKYLETLTLSNLFSTAFVLVFVSALLGLSAKVTSGNNLGGLPSVAEHATESQLGVLKTGLLLSILHHALLWPDRQLLQPWGLLGQYAFIGVCSTLR